MVIRVNGALFPLPLALFLTGMLLIEYSDISAAFLMVSGLALYISFYVLLRCPVCKKSPYLRRAKAPAWAYSLPLAERNCSQCGLVFSRAEVGTRDGEIQESR
jgi:hypothetical protein